MMIIPSREPWIYVCIEENKILIFRNMIILSRELWIYDCKVEEKKLFVALFYGQSGCFYLFQHWLYCLLNQVFVTFELKTREKFSTSVAVLTILSREPWIFLYSAILPNSAIFTSKIFQ